MVTYLKKKIFKSQTFFSRAIFFSVFLIYTLPTFASNNDWYISEVPVADRSDAVRESAIKQALTQVLVKVSNHATASQINTKFSALLNNAAQYVAEYRYLDEQALANQSPLYLRVQFDKAALTRLLHAQQLSPATVKSQPFVLVWLMTQTGKDMRLLSATANSPLVGAINNAAKTRGLNITLPVLDLDDLNNLTAQDVANNQVDKIRNASKRYAADMIVIGNLDTTHANNWQGNWTLLVGDKTIHWTSQTTQPIDIAKQTLEQVAMNTQQASVINLPVDDVGQRAVLIVKGVNNYTDYLSIRRYLHTLSLVKKISGENLNSDQVSFVLRIDGTMDEFKTALAKDSHWQAVNNSDPNSNKLYYQWMG